MGIRTGSAKRLQDVVPQSVAVHCCAHRVELAIKSVNDNIPFLKSVEKTVHILYKMYYNFPLCRHGLKQVGQMLQAHVLILLVKLQGTQWIAHRAQHLNTTLTNHLNTTLTNVKFLLFVTVCLTLTGWHTLVINFTRDMMHTPTSFPRTAIIGIYACVA